MAFKGALPRIGEFTKYERRRIYVYAPLASSRGNDTQILLD